MRLWKHRQYLVLFMLIGMLLMSIVGCSTSPAVEATPQTTVTMAVPSITTTLAGTTTPDALDAMTESMAVDYTQDLIFKMWDCFQTGTPLTVPNYLMDNANTHLALRYVDYHLAEIRNNADLTLVSLAPVKATCLSFEKCKSDGSVNASLMACVQFERRQSNVIGTNIKVDITLTPLQDGIVITGLDMTFNDTYNSLRSAVTQASEGKPITIDLIDQVVDRAMDNFEYK